MHKKRAIYFKSLTLNDQNSNYARKGSVHQI